LQYHKKRAEAFHVKTEHDDWEPIAHPDQAHDFQDTIWKNHWRAIDWSGKNWTGKSKIRAFEQD